MNQNTKIFVIDADGVIFDSTEECLVTAWNARQAFTGESHFITQPRQADPDYARHFRSIRNYVRTADEYLTVFRSPEGQIASQKTFEEQLSRIPESQKKQYTKHFYAQRGILKNRDLTAWLKLHRVYPGIVELLKYVKSLFRTLIVTGRDKESILDFFQLFNIPINEENIFDKTAAKDKMTALRTIGKTENIPYPQICFLDDNPTHLIKPKRAGVDVIMAGWGYGLPEHRLLAEKEGIPILTIRQLNRLIKNYA